ncbi:MAG: putative ABC transport system permease protein [Pseudohongiellaceae bacterium]|jgi:putative ABC transport system permease protein
MKAGQRSRRLFTCLSVLIADARAHRLQTLATLLGLAVGVAVIVAIHLASQAALQRFQGTFEGLTGVATHQLVGVEPLPASRLNSLRSHPSVLAVHPVVATTLIVPPTELRESPLSLRLVGVDPLFAAPFLQLDVDTLASAAGGRLFERLMTEPGLVVIDRNTLEQFGLSDGELLTVRGPDGLRELPVLAIDEPRLSSANPPLVLADIASAQEIVGLSDRVLRFDLVMATDKGELPLLPGEMLDPAQRRGERANSMTSAFRMNLLCLGFLAVLVGSFVAFNMAQFAVTRRRPLLGRLRCLGCSARDLLAATLLEAGVMGLAASALGVLAGRLLANALVADVARTVSAIYGPLGGIPEPTLDGVVIAGAMALGTFASVAATWSPARSAARTAPVAVAGAIAHDPIPRPRTPLLLLGVAALALVPEGSPVVLPALAVIALLLATATALPRALGLITSRRLKSTVPALAMGRIGSSLARTGGAAGALAMPLAMTIAIVIMVGSFRSEVAGWSEAFLGADVYMKPRFAELAPASAFLDQALLEELAQLPELDALDVLRTVEQVNEERSFFVGGTTLESIRDRGSLRLIEGKDLPTILDGLSVGGALLSEPLSRKSGLHPGDKLPLLTRNGTVMIDVVGVFQDFSYDRGYALLDASTFIEHFGPTPVQSAALLLRPDVDEDALVARLSQAHPDVVFQTVSRLRANVISAFDETFAITYLLQAISTALALVGILTALLCLHLERRHELGVLRALGAGQQTLASLLILEALIIMAVASVAALPTGIALAWILVAVVNTRSFGWSFPMQIDVPAVAGVMALALVAGLAAGVVPWLMARKTAVARQLEPRT